MDSFEIKKESKEDTDEFFDIPIKTKTKSNIKFEVKRELKDEISLQIGLDIIDQLDLPVNKEIQDIKVKKELVVSNSDSTDDIIIAKPYCALCQLEIHVGTMDQHLNGKNHNRKLKYGYPEKSACAYCTLCETITRLKELDEHLSGKKHKRKFKEKSTMLHINSTDFIITDHTKMPYYCDLCQVPCGSQQAWYSHLNGKQHGKNKANTEKEKAKENETQKEATLFMEGFKNKKRGLDKTFNQNDSNLTDKKFKKEA